MEEIMPQINYSVVKDHDLSANAFITLLTIRHITDYKNSEAYYVPLQQVYYFLTNETTIPLNHRILFQKAFKELADSEYLDGELLGNNVLLVNKIYFDRSQKWVYVDPVVLKEIYRVGGRSKAALLRYYCVVMGSRWQKDDVLVGHYSLAKLAEDAGKNTLTIMKYNKILEKGHFIYIFRSRDQETCNYYGAYEHKDAVYKYCMSQRNAS